MPDAPRVPAEILQLRESIDNIDAALIYMLAERFRCTERVGQLKAAGGLPPADLEREGKQIERLAGIAQTAGLDPVFAEALRTFIVSEVIRRHEAIAAERDGEAPVLDIYS